jgi:DNA-binding NtrC family response regulator
MKGTVLIVDDDETLRNSLAEVLTGAGFHCLTASSATEALEVLKYRGSFWIW